MQICCSTELLISSEEKEVNKPLTHLETLEIVSIEPLLNELNWDLSRLIDFSILLGTDYNKNPPNVGPSTAYKIIQEYNSLDNIMECSKTSLKLNKFDFSCIENYKEIKRVFTHSPIEETLEIVILYLNLLARK